jgi:hypothetical protein
MESDMTIEALFNDVSKALFYIDGGLDYSEITAKLIELANAVHSTDQDDDTWLYLGESGECCLPDLIVGAYWHYSEWHNGQWSDGYAALSALGQVFSPGMAGPEDDNVAYQALNDMAQSDQDSRSNVG